jgi:5-hydroxyisourate hydrolase-like protein (transthyretin family)
MARSLFVVVVAAALAAQNAAPPRSAASYRIAGVVVSSVTGQPLPNVTVAITPTDDRQSSRTMETAADGRFAFTSVPAGKYSLTTVSTRGYRAQGLNQHGNYFTGIAVGPDLDAERLVFRLVPDATIEGTVTDDDGDPVRNANVALFERNNDTGQPRTELLSNAATDDRGYYQFAHLAPATYFLAVSARPWYAQYAGPGEAQAGPGAPAPAADEQSQLDVAYPMTFYPAAEDSSGASPIMLHPDERVTADVVLRAVPAVHLRIKTGETNDKNGGARGFPRVLQRVFEGTLVPVMAAQGFGYTAGAYEYTGMAPGRYVVEMSSSDGRPGKKAGIGWYKELELSGTTEINVNEAPALASVAGAVVLEDSARRVDKMYVQLIDRTSRENFTTEVSSKGLFDFKGIEIRPGTYDVFLSNAPGFQLKSLVARGARVTGQTLEISGGGVQLVCTATRASARINGVVLRDDKPFAGAMVVLVPRDPVGSWTRFRRDQSDSDGTFTLPQVLPGTYTVIALENRWDLDWASPPALQPYLKNGTPIDVAGEGKLGVKVQLQ